MTRKSYNTGFTLIELLVASAILILACSSSFVMLRGVSGSILHSSQLTRALYLSEAMLEEIRSKDFDALEELNEQTFSEGKGRVFIKPVLADLKEIKISFVWDQKRAPLNLYTLRSKYE